MWDAFAQELAAHNGHPKAITHVAIDTNPAYRTKRKARGYRTTKNLMATIYLWQVSCVTLATDTTENVEEAENC